MLLNPYKNRGMSIVPGTRVLQDSLGLAGFQHMDPAMPGRIWTLHYLFAPIERRALGGIRAKFVDNKGFTSFCNQRDLEVLLGIANPGDYCYWLDSKYPDPDDADWYGLCVDSEDLLDDLQDRELRLREQYPGVLPGNLEIVRRVHDAGKDSQELLTLLWDMDPETGYSPDTRLETIERRWVLVERTYVKWAYVDL